MVDSAYAANQNLATLIESQKTAESLSQAPEALSKELDQQEFLRELGRLDPAVLGDLYHATNELQWHHQDSISQLEDLTASLALFVILPLAAAPISTSTTDHTTPAVSTTAPTVSTTAAATSTPTTDRTAAVVPTTTNRASAAVHTTTAPTKASTKSIKATHPRPRPIPRPVTSATPAGPAVRRKDPSPSPSPSTISSASSPPPAAPPASSHHTCSRNPAKKCLSPPATPSRGSTPLIGVSPSKSHPMVLISAIHQRRPSTPGADAQPAAGGSTQAVSIARDSRKPHVHTRALMLPVKLIRGPSTPGADAQPAAGGSTQAVSIAHESCKRAYSEVDDGEAGSDGEVKAARTHQHTDAAHEAHKVALRAEVPSPMGLAPSVVENTFMDWMDIALKVSASPADSPLDVLAHTILGLVDSQRTFSSLMEHIQQLPGDYAEQVWLFSAVGFTWVSCYMNVLAAAVLGGKIKADMVLSTASLKANVEGASGVEF
ncbi:hypothetical protein M422DRAFT_247572 [Sphaerobolus stellatus SS14]|uniref:Uncharacterized protein n=1 Tax=Sphaerobolus stellatus (strain SS14) TaxID=990650 RepID=A0A0C9V8J0_SPHS4|nr:hypothetical protein M422DRAFT_253502 [Sphaerobolus stellatus SS14]KIJ48715.1 hypothetical protein M422DRAFT_247572 [Sphaerobolus stellatus SS14]